MTASHIAIILHDFSTGGSERIAIRLANAWAKAGRQVTLYCGTEEGALRALVDRGVTVTCCDPPIARSHFSRILLGLGLARAIRRDQPDVLFVPGNYHLLVAAILARMRYAKRPVFIGKLSNPVRSDENVTMITKVSEWLMRVACNPVDAFTAMSPALRDQAVCVFKRQPIHVLAEPILDDDLTPLSEIALVHQPIEIVCAGRLARQKDFALALRSFARIDAATNARLVIYGEGPLLANLQALARRLGISDRVHFAGYVRDIRTHLRQARLFLMTSRFEGYPAVLIEALAAGVPVVTTNCSPAIVEIVSSARLGEVTTSRDPDKIAAAIDARIADGAPDKQELAASTGKHRMAIASASYLACFDDLLVTAISG